MTSSRPSPPNKRVISKRGAVQGSAKKKKKEKKKTPGGFLFNGARRGSALAVWFINGTQTRRPPPLPLPPAPAADQRDGLDGMDVEACLLRKLFLAAWMANTNFPSLPLVPPRLI